MERARGIVVWEEVVEEEEDTCGTTVDVVRGGMYCGPTMT